MLAAEAGTEACGIEYIIDDQCGTLCFHDINGLFPSVGDPMDVLGWAPPDRMSDRLRHHIRRIGG